MYNQSTLAMQGAGNKTRFLVNEDSRSLVAVLDDGDRNSGTGNACRSDAIAVNATSGNWAYNPPTTSTVLKPKPQSHSAAIA